MASDRSIILKIFVPVVMVVISLFLAEFAASFFAGPLDQVEARGETRSIRLKLMPAGQSETVRPSKATQLESNDTVLKTEVSLNVNQFQAITTKDQMDLGLSDDFDNVMFLGGSTTETKLVDEDLRWPELAVRLTNKSCGTRYRSFNYGVSGNNVMHSTATFFAYGRTVKPKIVYIHHMINDVLLLAGVGDYAAQGNLSKSLFVSAPKPSVLRTTARYFRDNWFPNLGHMARTALSSFMQNTSPSAPYKIDFSTPQGEQYIWDGFSTQLTDLLNMVQNRGAVPVVVIQGIVRNHEAEHFAPMRKRVISRGSDLQKFIAVHQNLDNRLVSYLEERGIGYIDLREFGNETDMYDLVHYNAEGSKKVADKIAASLKKFSGATCQDS